MTDFLNLEIEDDVLQEADENTPPEATNLPTENTGSGDSLVDELSDEMGLKPSEIDEPAPPMDSINDDTDKKDEPKQDVPEGEISQEPIMPETMPGDGEEPEEKKDFSAPVTDSPFDNIEDDDNEDFAKQREEITNPEEANPAPDIPTPNEVANAEPEDEGPMKYVPLFQRRDTNDLTGFGTDNDFNGPSNQYDLDEVNTINELVASEASAMDEYTTAAKKSKLDTLQRLYSDIANEERFHLEQLLYAKSVITGEKYIPRDPDVKREYKELVALGMDEETAMTTAVDKVGLMPQGIDADDMLDAAQEVAEMREYFISVIQNTNMVLESMTDGNIDPDVSETIQEAYNTICGIEVENIFQEAVTNIKNEKTFNPFEFLIKLIQKIYGAIISFIKKIKVYARKLMSWHYKTWDWIKANGIKGLFSDGLRLYFFDDKLVDVDKAGVASYLQLCIDLADRTCSNCGVHIKYGKLSNIGGILGTDFQRVNFRTVDEGFTLLKGMLISKSKLVINDTNEDALATLFFGYSKNQVKGYANGKMYKSDKSANIFNNYTVVLELAQGVLEIMKNACTELNNLQSVPQSVAFTHNTDVYKPAQSYMTGIVKCVQKVVNALTSDVDECMKLENKLAELTKQMDANRAKYNRGGTMLGPDGKPVKTADQQRVESSKVSNVNTSQAARDFASPTSAFRSAANLT